MIRMRRAKLWIVFPAGFIRTGVQHCWNAFAVGEADQFLWL